MLSHIQDVHVFPQISKKSRYTCWWSGCKVYGRPSVSSNWLSRHVQQHSEAKGKPFSCIFDGCFQRFSSSNLLERHIDRHHVNPDALCGGASTKRSGSLPIMLEKTICGNRNPVSVKNCSRRVAKRKKKLRYFRGKYFPIQSIPILCFFPMLLIRRISQADECLFVVTLAAILWGFVAICVRYRSQLPHYVKSICIRASFVLVLPSFDKISRFFKVLTFLLCMTNGISR
ncbi:unnamed protein product [Mesocestoides corti]|uniref:C2H2-type domain-containing protein n=1 Tax=Mesocestoides corti TaxID=53468 RepID=A0A3P6GKH7_MESCO|nr:unnamed protein product [Mesocestoides corti]